MRDRSGPRTTYSPTMQQPAVDPLIVGDVRDRRVPSWQDEWSGFFINERFGTEEYDLSGKKTRVSKLDWRVREVLLVVGT